MISSVAHSNVLVACRVLFGAEVRVDRGFLAGLDVAMVRRHFHRRAIEVHPDRATILRRPPAALVEAFTQVEGAYRTLRAYLAAGKPTAVLPDGGNDRAPSPSPSRPAPSARGHANTGPVVEGWTPPAREPNLGSVAADHHWSGPIPSRSLRLGEYLYYSRRISWRELIRALVWQARQRPQFGHVASRLGLLTPELVAKVLSQRRAQERIGEAALRLRLMNSREQQVVLHVQRHGSRRLGDYFVQAGLLSSAELERFGRGVRIHNARVTTARS